MTDIEPLDGPQYEDMPLFIDTEAQAFWDSRQQWFEEDPGQFDNFIECS